MKFFLHQTLAFYTFFSGLIIQGWAEPIAIRSFSASAPTNIKISAAIDTTLMFPTPISGVFGLGLVQAQSSTSNGQGGQPTVTAGPSGTVLVEHPGPNLLVLHSLSAEAKVLMTVLMDKQLYVFDVVTGNQPDVAITFVKDDAAANLVSGASSSGLVSGKELSKQDIVAMRPKFDPELLVGFVRQANDAELLRRLYPDLYRDYSWRPADYPWETNGVKTVVNHIHRFSEGDAVVLTGSVTNNTGQPLGFAARAVQVSVNDSEIHPAKLTDCKQPIAPGETVPIVVVLQGDIDGARANLSLLNSFRIVPPQGVDPYSKSYGYNNSTQPKTALSGDGKKVIQKTRHD